MFLRCFVDSLIIFILSSVENKGFFPGLSPTATTTLSNIEIDKFSGLLLNYAKKKNSKIILRGLRALSDFEFEFQRALMNRKIDSDVETIFIMTKQDYVYLNSSIVKEIAMFRGNVKPFVPEAVEKKLMEKFR